MVKAFQVLCAILTAASMASIGLPPLHSDSIHDPHAVPTELQAQYPDHTKRLMDAIRAAEPIAVSKAMEVIGDDLLKTFTMVRVVHEVPRVKEDRIVPARTTAS